MKIDYAQIPGWVSHICSTLHQAGHQAHLVGGGIRDLLLERPVHDWDVATSARPEQVQKIFRRTIPTGIRHGTVTVLLSGGARQVEVTTYRGEGAYSDGRHPDSVSYVDAIEEDLERRDLTINAMALDPLQQKLIDPVGGAEDLGRRLIRAVGDPRARFAEDGLRPMRAVRFAALLEFSVEPLTLAAMAGALDRFRLVSWERIRDELLKLLEAPRPSKGITLMQQTGLLAHVLPELQQGRGLQQNRHHTQDVYHHSLAVCDAVSGDDILRLAALLHDVGKPATSAPSEKSDRENTFYGHEERGAELCEEIGRRLKLSNAQRERVCRLVRLHGFALEGYKAPGLRRFLRRVGTQDLPDLLALRKADLQVKHDPDRHLAQLESLRRRLEEIVRQAPPLSPQDLAVSGRDVIQHLGIQPGPRVGQTLRGLLERVLEDPSLNQRETLLRLMDEEMGASE